MGIFDNIFGNNSEQIKQLTSNMQQLTEVVTVLAAEVTKLKKDKAALLESNEKLAEEKDQLCYLNVEQSQLIDELKSRHGDYLSEEENNLKRVLAAVPVENYRVYNVNYRDEARRIIRSVQLYLFHEISDQNWHKAWNAVYSRMRQITTVDLYHEYDYYYKPKHPFSCFFTEMVSSNELWFSIFETAAKQITFVQRKGWVEQL